MRDGPVFDEVRSAVAAALWLAGETQKSIGRVVGVRPSTVSVAIERFIREHSGAPVRGVESGYAPGRVEAQAEGRRELVKAALYHYIRKDEVIDGPGVIDGSIREVTALEVEAGVVALLSELVGFLRKGEGLVVHE